MTDTERINWLQKQDGYALISDDRGYWALVVDGCQNVPDDVPADIYTEYFIRRKDWHKTMSPSPTPHALKAR